jgi:hypothetical protein
VKDLLGFLDLKLLLLGAATWLGLSIAVRARRNTSAPIRVRTDRRWNANGFALLVLWYLFPVGLFFGLACTNGPNLFVERYLILASLPVFMALPELALAAGPMWVGRAALSVYFFAYQYSVPGAYFMQKGEFSQGVPGGNEWREALGQLAEPRFQSQLFLFQSPFIESNQLDFANNPLLARYLSAPLHSFYVKGSAVPFVLLPVHWWIENPAHQRFKSEIRDRLLVRKNFTLLATQEFFENFEPWLKKQASADGEWHVLEGFRSTGALRLKRLGWTSSRHGPL